VPHVTWVVVSMLVRRVRDERCERSGWIDARAEEELALEARGRDEGVEGATDALSEEEGAIVEVEEDDGQKLRGLQDKSLGTIVD